jgi:hypothetical protein
MNRGGFRVEHDVGGIAGLSIAYEVFNEQHELDEDVELRRAIEMSLEPGHGQGQETGEPLAKRAKRGHEHATAGGGQVLIDLTGEDDGGGERRAPSLDEVRRARIKKLQPNS